ncbi:MAG: hypothetical protein K6T34_10850 [Thermoflavifilum sp.]|nr:hypothetical protein [Thermoflavifilum sp.]
MKHIEQVLSNQDLAYVVTLDCLGGISIQVRSDRETVLSFLRAYVTPYFRDTTSTVYDLCIETYNNVDFSSLERDVLSLDFVGIVPVHYNETASVYRYYDIRLYHYQQTRHIVVVQPSNRRVVLIPSQDSIDADYLTMRIVRQIVEQTLKRKNCVHVHAAAVDIDGFGILMPGRGGTGKTTLMISLLQVLGANYVSNDKTFLRTSGDEFFAIGWPQSINVFPTSFARNTIPHEFSHYQHTEWPPYKMGKRTITVAELCTAVGCNVSSYTNIRAIVFPNKDEIDLVGRIRRIPPERAKDMLSGIFRPDLYTWWLSIDGISENRIEREEREYLSVIKTMVEEIPAYEIGTYSSLEQLTELISPVIQLR